MKNSSFTVGLVLAAAFVSTSSFASRGEADDQWFERLSHAEMSTLENAASGHTMSRVDKGAMKAATMSTDKPQSARAAQGKRSAVTTTPGGGVM